MTIEIKMNEILKDVVQDAALTTEILENIRQLIADNETMEAEIIRRKADTLEHLKTIKAQYERIQVLVAQNDTLMEREEQLQKRELKADLKHMEVVHQKQRVEDHKEMIGLIFRNVRHMESVTSLKGVPVEGGGNGSCGFVAASNESETIEREDK